MAADSLLQLQASVTKTATFASTGVNIPSGTPRRGLFARVIYSAATNASGSNTVTFEVDVSTDNSTWFAKTIDNEHVVNLTTTAKSGEFHIPIETSDAYVRLQAVVAGAGSTPTITYQGDLVLGRPG